jgi:hypothetical protein
VFDDEIAATKRTCLTQDTLSSRERYILEQGNVKVIKSKTFIKDITGKTAAILSRLQGREVEVFDGVYDKKDFLNRLDRAEIHYNIAYLVANKTQLW